MAAFISTYSKLERETSKKCENIFCWNDFRSNLIHSVFCWKDRNNLQGKKCRNKFAKSLQIFPSKSEKKYQKKQFFNMKISSKWLSGHVEWSFSNPANIFFAKLSKFFYRKSESDYKVEELLKKKLYFIRIFLLIRKCSFDKPDNTFLPRNWIFYVQSPRKVVKLDLFQKIFQISAKMFSGQVKSGIGTPPPPNRNFFDGWSKTSHWQSENKKEHTSKFFKIFFSHKLPLDT